MSAGTARAAAAVALAAALAAASVLGLSGCGPQQPFTPTVQTAKGLTAAGSARQVLDLFHATQEVVGADGWYEQQNWFPSCGSQDLGLAFSMYMEKSMPVGGADAKALLQHVQVVWEKHGIDATIALNDDFPGKPFYVLSAPHYLTGTYPDGSAYQLQAGYDTVIFYVQGKCGTGPRPKYGSPDWPQFPTQPPTPPATPGASGAPAASAAPGASGEAAP